MHETLGSISSKKYKLKSSYNRVGEIAHEDAKPENPSAIPGINMVEGEKRLLKVVLCPTQAHFAQHKIKQISE